MKMILEQGLGVWGIGVLTVFFVLVRLCLFVYYTRLNKACGNFWRSTHKALAYIKKDLKQREEEHREMKNSTVYTECRLAECKVGIIRLGVLECMMQQSILLVPLCGIMIAFAGVLNGSGHRDIFSVLFASGAAVVELLLLDLCGGVKEKHRRLRLYIRDAIENGWERTEEKQEEGVKEVLLKKEKRKEKKEERRNEKRIRNVREKQATTGKRKPGKAQEEKRRLTEELLRERRQLEARNLAELLKREKKEETELQQVCAEAAITEQPVVHAMSGPEKEDDAGRDVSQAYTYEALLSEVLTEYLA